MNPNTLAFVVGAWAALGFGALTYGLAALLTSGDEKEAEDVGDDDVDQLSMIEAMEARDAVLASVDESNAEWMGEAVAVFERCPIAEGIGETFRNWMAEEGGLQAPKSAHAWGALFGRLKKRGLIVMTGDWRPSRNATSRARLSPVYRKVVRMAEAAE